MKFTITNPFAKKKAEPVEVKQAAVETKFNSLVEKEPEKRELNIQMKSVNPVQTAKAKNSLVSQIDEVINNNADGAVVIALRVRQSTDLLLSLGISDPASAQASIWAQQALHLVNVGRGNDLQGKKLNLSLEQRLEVVSSALGAVLMAEKLLEDARSQNQLGITQAIKKQQQILGVYQSNQSNLQELHS